MTAPSLLDRLTPHRVAAVAGLTFGAALLFVALAGGDVVPVWTVVAVPFAAAAAGVGVLLARPVTTHEAEPEAAPDVALTPTELGRELGIHRRDVINKAMEFGVPIFQGRISRHAFLSAVKAPGWNPAMGAEIEKLRAKRLTLQEIAELLEQDPASCTPRSAASSYAPPDPTAQMGDQQRPAQSRQVPTKDTNTVNLCVGQTPSQTPDPIFTVCATASVLSGRLGR